jgi:hypothetical protein
MNMDRGKTQQMLFGVEMVGIIAAAKSVCTEIYSQSYCSS